MILVLQNFNFNVSPNNNDDSTRLDSIVVSFSSSLGTTAIRVLDLFLGRLFFFLLSLVAITGYKLHKKAVNENDKGGI
jgi:hypothetical protein